MRSSRYVSLFVAGLSFALAASAASGLTILGQVEQYKNAVLLKNGNQTLCSVAVVTETYGLVAANCLQLSSTGTADLSQKYQVSISGNNDTMVGTFDITKATINPNFDPTTMANNLAIVYYDASSKGKISNAIADWPAEWTSYYFVHQTLTKDSTPLWNSPLVAVSKSQSDPADCAKLSTLYGQNKVDLICSQMTAPTYATKGCVAPFGSLYGVTSSNLALGALFSHSASSGSNGLCGTTPVYTYYIILRNYLAWVAKEVGSQVPVYHDTTSGYSAQTNAGYAMGSSSSSSTTTSSTLSSSSVLAASTTVASAASSSSSSSSSSAAVSATAAAVITAFATAATTIISTVTLPAATVTVTTTATAPAVVSTVTATSVITSVSVSTLTVTPAPSVVYVTLPPIVQTIVSTATATITSVVTSIVAVAIPEPTASATPTPTAHPSTDTASSSKPSGGAIAAIVILLLLLLGLLAFWYIRRRGKKNQDGYYNDKDDNGLTRVRRWFFGRANEPPRSDTPPLIRVNSGGY